MTMGTTKIKKSLLQAAGCSTDCTILEEDLATTDVAVSGLDSQKCVKKLTISDTNGNTLEVSTKDANNTVEMTCSGACPSKCKVAKGDS